VISPDASSAGSSATLSDPSALVATELAGQDTEMTGGSDVSHRGRRVTKRLLDLLELEIAQRGGAVVLAM
jgi:hypothetical protein